MRTGIKDGIIRRFEGIGDRIRAAKLSIGFDHGAAQKYEFNHNRRTIKQSFARVYAQFETEKAAGGLWQSADDQWFLGDVGLFNSFVEHVRNRKGLEVGSGPFGYIAPCYWIKDRVIIEPLIDRYREAQLNLTGKTFFSDEIKGYSSPAEQVIPELVGKVDGFIACRNALDHCEDPMTILLNLSDYAAPGCWLLLWTDLWHLAGLDAGHHNITKTQRAMDAYLNGLGFDVVKRGETIRDPAEYVEYGIIARKRMP
jgi:hypothetical protein